MSGDDAASAEAPVFVRLSDHVFMAAVDGVAPLNVGLVVGEDHAVLVDPGPADGDVEPLLEAVAAITEAPLTVVCTHGHADHTGAVPALAARGAEIVAHRDAGVAEATRTLADEPLRLDLGGVVVHVEHLGRGHTDADLVIGVAGGEGVGDAAGEEVPGVLFCGDLVREGTDPRFRDSYPQDWVRTLGRIRAAAGEDAIVVPGHGRPVDAEFVAAMRRRMQQGHQLSREAIREAVGDATKAIPIIPYGPEESRELITRMRSGH
ncbi:MBL fold metallo-hydrolase [Nesterenkonia sp. F]|uniref:MBL fold metallo-hydrolase n=1 Tax=Nesterenkonia sp. F TaxID=795955 RepID=UPI000255D1CB|nr:MBL fold metallo-hydrolase [Nesterenkonia sp. F]